MREYRTFLVPYDFSDHSRFALDTALELVRHFKGDLHLLHVIQPPFYATTGFAEAMPTMLLETRHELLEALQRVVTAIPYPPGRVESHVIEGINIAASIAESATDLGADLIVMGTHGRTGLRHTFMGSVTERTLRIAHCPVLTVRATEQMQSKDGRMS